ncbi:MAG: ferritin-like domain-containing protein [Rubrivivax sp.]
MPLPIDDTRPSADLRHQALQLLLCADPDAKARGARQLDANGWVDVAATIECNGTIPGRPALPQLLPHTRLKQRSVHTTVGRAALIHSLVHIELNAIDLALDVCWRFPGMPEPFYRQWLQVAREEALHFELLRDHLRTLGHVYGDFVAHDGLWQMAERTRHELLARIALVPRTLEARGLDASPAVKAKLLAAGDQRGGEILDIILRDEIGHVAIGNHWFRWLCERDGIDPLPTYAELAQRHQAPRLRAPFNLEARRAAGFDDAELQALLAG